MSGAQQQDPEVKLTLRVSVVNLILASLDMNPTKASTMAVAGIMQDIQRQATEPAVAEVIEG